MNGAYSVMFLQIKLRRVVASRFDPFPVSVGTQLLRVLVKLARNGGNGEEPTFRAVTRTTPAALHNASLHHLITILLHMRNANDEIKFI